MRLEFDSTWSPTLEYWCFVCHNEERENTWCILQWSTSIIFNSIHLRYKLGSYCISSVKCHPEYSSDTSKFKLMWFGAELRPRIRGCNTFSMQIFYRTGILRAPIDGIYTLLFSLSVCVCVVVRRANIVVQNHSDTAFTLQMYCNCMILVRCVRALQFRRHRIRCSVSYQPEISIEISLGMWVYTFTFQHIINTDLYKKFL